MTIERFTKQEFEDALPIHKETQEKLWSSLGLVSGEECYLVHINDDIKIFVRSSIDSAGVAKDTGDDSIRMWLVNGNNEPLGSKVDRWTNRTPGWDVRMLDKMRTLWGWARAAGHCPDCNKPRGVYKSKTKKNPNRIFSKCRECNKWGDWIT